MADLYSIDNLDLMRLATTIDKKLGKNTPKTFPTDFISSINQITPVKNPSNGQKWNKIGSFSNKEGISHSIVGVFRQFIYIYSYDVVDDTKIQLTKIDPYKKTVVYHDNVPELAYIDPSLNIFILSDKIYRETINGWLSSIDGINWVKAFTGTASGKLIEVNHNLFIATSNELYIIENETIQQVINGANTEKLEIVFIHDKYFIKEPDSFCLYFSLDGKEWRINQYAKSGYYYLNNCWIRYDFDQQTFFLSKDFFSWTPCNIEVSFPFDKIISIQEKYLITIRSSMLHINHYTVENEEMKLIISRSGGNTSLLTLPEKGVLLDININSPRPSSMRIWFLENGKTFQKEINLSESPSINYCTLPIIGYNAGNYFFLYHNNYITFKADKENGFTNLVEGTLLDSTHTLYLVEVKNGIILAKPKFDTTIPRTSTFYYSTSY